MPSRRFACFLLGLWLGGGLLMAWAAVANLRTAERLVASPAPAAAVLLKEAGPAARGLLRHEAGEQTRALLEDWGLIEIALGALLFLYLLFGTDERKRTLLLALAMALIAIFQRFALTPQIVSVGRYLDFVEGPSLSSARLSALNGSFLGIELVKWGIGAWLIGRWLFGHRRRSTDVRQQLNLIDKANYRHIDR